MLKLNDLRLWVSLGCTEEEKYHPQPIKIDLEFFLPNDLAALKSDRLEDTICYAQIAQLIEERICHRRFNLIEHLTYCIFETIEQEILLVKNFDIRWKIMITKLSPPVPHVHGGVSFSYEK